MNFSKQQYENDEYLMGYDCSGSTGIGFRDSNVNFYHLKTQDIENNILNDKTNVTRIRWDHCITKITKKDLEEINKKRIGFGGTNPEVLVDYIIFHVHLLEIVLILL